MRNTAHGFPAKTLFSKQPLTYDHFYENEKFYFTVIDIKYYIAMFRSGKAVVHFSGHQRLTGVW